jgi:hypothetical protein
MVSTPWAILLTKFNDNGSEPHTRSFYENLFTMSGTGSENTSMVDFFRDMSHGILDLSGTQIFPSIEIGWFTLDKSFNDYLKIRTDPSLGLYAKLEPLVKWPTEVATRYRPDWPKVDLSKFYGVVVVYNIGEVCPKGWEAFGGSMLGGRIAVCDETTVKPSVLGQEMGHAYGLSHSRSDCLGDADYKDGFDIMSTRDAMSASHPAYDSIHQPEHWVAWLGDMRINDYKRSIGPGLNAANMDGRGWLDNSRVWRPSDGTPIYHTEGELRPLHRSPVHGTIVKLRPLHRLDLSGSLAIIIDKYYVEFRMNERWDAGLQRPVVLIHYFEDNISYLMGHVDVPVRFGDADPDWSLYGDILIRNGDNFEIKEGEGTAFYYHLKIELQNIDVEKRTASISIDYSGVPSIHPEPLYIWPWEYRSPAIPQTPLGSAQDIVIINQKIIRASHWSLRPILKSLADISSSERFSNEEIRKTIRREALKTIIKIAEEELKEMDLPGGPALPRGLGGQS